MFLQADLPTFFDFSSSSLPFGWNANGTSNYLVGGVPGSLKFDNTNDKLVIQFNSNPGVLSYSLKGNSFSAGVFAIEESENGTDWISLHNHTNLTNVTTKFIDTLNFKCRYIRFIYTMKVNGNVALDDVKIDVASPVPEQEINVQYNSRNLINGELILFNSPDLSTVSVDLFIQNIGSLNELIISSVTVAGTDVAEFSIQSNFTNISPSSSQNLKLNFTPSSVGSKKCQLIIKSNDVDASVFIINVYAVGGNLATEPLNQPKNLLFSTNKTYRIIGSFSPSINAEAYLILKKKGNNDVFELPLDGVEYKQGDTIGQAIVVSSSEFTFFSPTSIEANSNYNFAVFAYSGYGIFRNYLIDMPLKGTLKTPISMVSTSYYNAISFNSASFPSDLHNLISNHKSYNYSEYFPLMIEKFEARDTTNDRHVITCVYSGENKIYSNTFDWDLLGFSREHSYCHSWMPSYPANTPELPEYIDFHHLFPVNQKNVNEIRSNYPFGKVEVSFRNYFGSKFGFNSRGEVVFEPRDEHKGDVARALFYMIVCYNGIKGYNWGFKDVISPTIQYGQDQEILKEWNMKDPPSNWEIARNDFIDSLQGNRNPFIDHPEFACYIDFTSMKHLINGCSSTISEFKVGDLHVYPNPFDDEVIVQLNDFGDCKVELLDQNARVVYHSSFLHESSMNIDLSELQSGIYYLRVISDTVSYIQKLVKK